MQKICHIRCNQDYWKTLHVYDNWVKNKKQYSYYTKIIDLWNKYLNIDYLSFRKIIRDIVIQHIQQTNCFDIILESNQQCKDYFLENNSKNILFFQQDDDDIFLKLPETHELTPGINMFNYCFIDPIGGRRKKGYKNREFGTDKPTKKTQSNHSLIFNKQNEVDIITNSLYNADHTYYDKLLEVKSSKIFNFPISIQFYHLHSMSLWKHQLKFSNTDYTNKDCFLNYVDSYIKEVSIFGNNNKDIPLIRDFVESYYILL